MAREYSRHQQNLIRSFYRHRDEIETQRLQEIVTDIYLAGQGKKADSLWKRAAQILERTPGLDRAEVARLIEGRDVEALARLAGAGGGGEVHGHQQVFGFPDRHGPSQRRKS